MKTTLLTYLVISLINTLFLGKCFSQGGYEMKENETIYLDRDGNIVNRTIDLPFSSKQNPGTTTLSDSIRIKSDNNNGSFNIPGYTPTGNTFIDEQNYEKAKFKFYQDNPEEYEKWVEKNSGQEQIIVVKYEEFSTMPVNKQEYLLEHPEKYFIEGLNDKQKQ